jgi:NodT family efflux transporter outer membrane factor (OMF) lipoprotein
MTGLRERTARPWLALVAFAATLCGCGMWKPSGPELPPMAVPADWSLRMDGPSSSAAGMSLAEWWRGFNDPRLTALVIRALEANTDIRTAQAALIQARALRDGKLAARLPKLDGSGSGQRSKSGYSAAVNAFQAGFDASWEPDVFGARTSALKAAEGDVQAAGASLADVRVSMAAEVAVAYVQLRGLQAQLAIARNNLATQSETLQITRWRAQAGLASSLDVEQGVAASEQTAAQIPVLDTGIGQAISSLAVLTAQAPDTLRSGLASAADVPQAPDALALAIPAATLRQRPDVRAAEHRISAALARVAQADAARYPSFQITGSLGLHALTLATLDSGASVARTLLAGVTVPLFDGGAARAQVRAQEAALEQARVAYEATVLGALKDVEDALVSLQGNRERLARLRTAAESAGNADLLARQRYISGLIDFRAVLETQRTLLSTQDSVESTRASLSADHVRLYKALGGGWTRSLEEIAP